MYRTQISRSEYEKLLSDLALLKETVRNLGKDEINPVVAKKLQKASELLDRGKGKKFSKIKDFRKYLRDL